MKNHYLKSQEGATATEYVILLVFIAIVIIGGATYFGGILDTKFSETGDEVDTGVN